MLPHSAHRSCQQRLSVPHNATDCVCLCLPLSWCLLQMVRAYIAVLFVALILSAEAQVLKPESMSNRASMGEFGPIIFLSSGPLVPHNTARQQDKPTWSSLVPLHTCTAVLFVHVLDLIL